MTPRSSATSTAWSATSRKWYLEIWHPNLDEHVVIQQRAHILLLCLHILQRHHSTFSFRSTSTAAPTANAWLQWHLPPALKPLEFIRRPIMADLRRRSWEDSSNFVTVADMEKRPALMNLIDLALPNSDVGESRLMKSHRWNLPEFWSPISRASWRRSWARSGSDRSEERDWSGS